jgi:hypothetical protein
MHAGEAYRFVNPAKEGWLFRGKRNAVTMQPQVSRHRELCFDAV